jgi:outer membrane protein TolC
MANPGTFSFLPRRKARALRLVLVGLLIALSGCHPTQPFYAHNDRDLSHYLDKAVTMEMPDAQHATLEEVNQSQAPLTLSNPQFHEVWDLTLQECVAITLQNSKVIRGGLDVRLQNGQLFAGGGEGSLPGANNVRSFSTIYNPAIVESNPGLQNDAPFSDGGLANIRQGVEGALADFDAQLQVFGSAPGGNGTFFTRQDRPQNIDPNNPSVLTGAFPSVIQTDTRAMTYQINKRTTEGTQLAIRGTTERDDGNTRGTIQALNSIWTQTIELQATQPLLRGRGSQVNRMPIMIARIGTDIELMNLNSQLQNTVCNVEIRYWDLYLAYRNLETAKLARDAAQVTWQFVETNRGPTLRNQDEAQAREQYYTSRAAVEQAQRDLFNSENELRLLMGLTATDGRLIRPIDEPTLAKVMFDWCDAHTEAITRRPELLTQRWTLKQREMELIWARNRLLPQLDVGGTYRFVGVGDEWITANRRDVNFPAEGSTAWQELTEGRFQEFSLTGVFTMPIGFRRELAAVRHQELRLARDKALLEDMELDVSHGLAKSIRNLDANFTLAQTQANRWAAAADEVSSRSDLQNVQNLQEELNLLLQAQRRRAQDQSSYWQAVCEYNKAIADVHLRKGSILEYCGVGFEEGPWPKKAYWDALGRARERDAARFIDYGWTRPRVMSQGALPPAGDNMQIERTEATSTAPADNVDMNQPAEEMTPETPRQPEAAPQDRLETRKDRSVIKSAANNPLRDAAGGSPAFRKPTVRQAAYSEPAPQQPAAKEAESGYSWGDLGLGGKGAK